MGDIENRYGGDNDDHLTEKGQRQSEELANRLAEKQIQKIFASPLMRAQETAAILATRLKLDVAIIPAFKERNGYGILTGMTKEEAMLKHPEQVALLKDIHAAVEGAEEYELFLQRIVSAFDNLATDNLQNVAVITHGGPIRLIFRDILKMGEIEVADCAFIVLESNTTDYKLVEQHGISVI